MDVSLGGGDAGVLVADASVDSGAGVSDTFDCEPCAATVACQAGRTCASIDGGDGFCFAQCDASAQCETDETCGRANDVLQVSRLACLPKVGACPNAVAPTGPDGGTLDQCGLLVGPHVADAGCKDCRYQCQKNGCYGGFYCNTQTKDCERPPSQCL